MAPDFGGMQVKKNVGRHHHDAVARRVVITVAKNRLPYVTFDNIAFDLIQKVHEIYPLDF
jgi:coproporphyrinogen III oxidase-like Fe-S oxidoreductase